MTFDITPNLTKFIRNELNRSKVKFLDDNPLASKITLALVRWRSCCFIYSQVEGDSLDLPEDDDLAQSLDMHSMVLSGSTTTPVDEDDNEDYPVVTAEQVIEELDEMFQVSIKLKLLLFIKHPHDDKLITMVVPLFCWTHTSHLASYLMISPVWTLHHTHKLTNTLIISHPSLLCNLPPPTPPPVVTHIHHTWSDTWW